MSGTYVDTAKGTLHPDFMPAIRTTQAVGAGRPSLSYWQDAWRRLKRNRQALVSLVIITGLLFFTILGPFLWKVDPAEQDLNRISEGPSFSRQAVVVDELATFEPVIASEVPEKPEAAAPESLAAPSSLEALGVATSQAVRLKWTAVPGAAGYVIYRNEREPVDASSLGVPVTELEGGNRLSYEDRFNLEPRTYYYSVVAKSEREASTYATLRVVLIPSITVENARKVRPEIAAGEFLQLSAHPLGTDYLGRDLLARMMAGARVSLFIGFFAPLLWTFFGVLLGGISGFVGGKWDGFLMRFTDFVLALPFLLFMILFKIAFGAQAGESGMIPMLIAMIALSWTGPARLARGQVLQLREAEFVQAARLLGGNAGYLLFRHLLPNTMGVILVSLTFSIPSAIFTEAFLSFIGMGVVPPTPSWGSMCNDGIQTFLTHPHEFLAPALLISLTVLAFNLLGDGLRDALDPRMRSLL